jgi:hypothetical protein
MGGSCCRSSQAFELAIPARRNRQLPGSTDQSRWNGAFAETSTACVHVAGGGETQHDANVDDQWPFGYLWQLGALLPSSALT